ncbi:hypothetical protein [Diplocloster agilis]|nr:MULTISPECIES: hypothetical protein [Lachnospiraceae]MCU6732830.1 hypothetical protein [Suonthocola fibrivorans]SCI64541.1 Uncharacterised protein [uncultured Clostridium sp.]
MYVRYSSKQVLKMFRYAVIVPLVTVLSAMILLGIIQTIITEWL